MRTTVTTWRESAARLNDTPWMTLFGYAYAATFTVLLLGMALPDPWRQPIKRLPLALPLLFLVAKDLAQIPDVAVRLRTLRAQGAHPFRLLAACLPPGVPGMVRLDRAIWRGFFCWLRRLPQPARPSGIQLGFQKEGAYSTVIAIGLLALFVELPLDAALLPLFLKDQEELRVIHVLLGLGSLYSLVWLLGDRWLVRGSCHVVTDTHLDLLVGARASARIPLAAVEQVQPLRDAVEAWRKAHPCRFIETVRITPFDKPNLVLTLRADADCTIVHHGVQRSGVRHVFLHLDRPAQLMAALEARQEPGNS